MTALARRLAERIRRDGPISVADYMQACLHDPEHGYYRRRAAVGSAGDFVTAPEISQVFGELIGLWCAVVWRQMGEPRALRLVEFGPGRGTLMRDALRAARAVPDFRAALRVELIEINPALIAQQRDALRADDVPITWRAEANARDGAAIVIANEFLDTLPISQWILRGGHWRQRCVSLDAHGRLAFAEGRVDASLRLPPSIAASAREGSVFEARGAGLDRLAAGLARLGPPLAALLVDYGHTAPTIGDTLQAVRAHAWDDPLRAPGESDLTAQVDFAELTARLSEGGLVCDGPMSQAEFLGSLGIAERASRLMEANPARAAGIESDVARLMAPTGMGTRFHAVGLRSAELPPLPGFASVDIAPGPT
jgi:SAM-dependent MidA family methyltransferase